MKVNNPSIYFEYHPVDPIRCENYLKQWNSKFHVKSYLTGDSINIPSYDTGVYLDSDGFAYRLGKPLLENGLHVKRISIPNLLRKTKTYLIGPMEFENGESWRNIAINELSKINITCFDPYNKPFQHTFDETDEFREKLKILRNTEQYEELSDYCKEFRIYDLNLVDRSDFIICYINPKVFTAGTMEELSWAVRLKKPIFIFVNGGKKLCPYWIFGMISHKYIYNSLDEVILKIKSIDDGSVKMDSDRWRLLKYDAR